MIRYSFFTQMQPPAPFVLLTLRHPQTGAEVQDVIAQLDTAADRTLLPLDLVKSLAFDKIGDIEIEGVGGTVEFMPLYHILLGIASRPLRPYAVVAHPGEPWVLLGRDVLNGHRVLFDGPNLVLEIGELRLTVARRRLDAVADEWRGGGPRRRVGRFQRDADIPLR